MLGMLWGLLICCSVVVVLGGLILITDKNIKNPRSASNVRDTVTREGANGITETQNNLIQGRKGLVFEAKFPDLFPNLLNGIHFRRIRRDKEQVDVIRDRQSL